MTVELRSLRVSAEMDAASFARGAQTVQESSVKASGAVGQLGATVTETQAKITRTDALERFSRQMIDGYGASQRFTSGLNTINRALETGRYSMAQAEAALEGLHRKLGMAANAGELAAKGQMQLAAAVETVNRRLAERARLPNGGMPLADNDNDSSARFRRQNLGYQLMDIGQSGFGGASPLLIAAQQGPQILQLYAGQEGINAALRDTATLLGGIATKFGPVAIAAGAAALAVKGLQSDIQDATGVAVTYGDTLKAIFQVTGDIIVTALQPAIDTIAPMFAKAWDMATAATKDAGNLIIGAAVGTVNAITATWAQLPKALVDISVQAANGVLNTIQTMTRNVLANVQTMINSLAQQLEGTPFAFGGINIDRKAILGPMGSWEIANPYPGAASGVGSAVGDAYGGAFGRDYIGDAYKSVVDAVGSQAVENYRSRTGATGEAGSTSGRLDPWANMRTVHFDKVAADARKAALESAQSAVEANREMVSSFVSDIGSAITSGGKDIGQQLVNAIQKVLNDLLDMSLKQIGDMIGKALFPDVPGMGKTPVPAGGDAWLGLRGAANDNVAAVANTAAKAASAGAGSGAGNAFLDYVARREGTAGQPGGGYNTSLGYGAFTGGERNLTSMTLNQIDALQTQMLRDPTNRFNSSALGRYQIVRTTRRGLQDQMGLNGSELFDADLQDRMGLRLAQARGPNARGLGQEWASLAGRPREEILAHYNAGLGRATSQIDKFTTSATAATSATAETASGLNSLGGGLGKLGSALGQFPTAPGGGSHSTLLGSLFGWGTASFGKALSPAAWSVVSSGGMTGLFAGGGYTGPGGVNEPAGVVHRGEIVWSQSDIARAGGIGAVEGMRRGLRGYAEGGYVGPRMPAQPVARMMEPKVVVNNYGSAQVETKATRDPTGNMSIEVMVDRIAAKKMSDPGSRTSRSMRDNFGAKRKVGAN